MIPSLVPKVPEPSESLRLYLLAAKVVGAEQTETDRTAKAPPTTDPPSIDNRPGWLVHPHDGAHNICVYIYIYICIYIYMYGRSIICTYTDLYSMSYLVYSFCAC